MAKSSASISDTGPVCGQQDYARWGAIFLDRYYWHKTCEIPGDPEEFVRNYIKETESRSNGFKSSMMVTA